MAISRVFRVIYLSPFGWSSGWSRCSSSSGLGCTSSSSSCEPASAAEAVAIVVVFIVFCVTVFSP